MVGSRFSFLAFIHSVNHKAVLGTEAEVDVVNLVGALVIAGEDCTPNKTLANFVLWVTRARFVSYISHEVEHIVSSKYFMNNVNVQHDTTLYLLKRGSESWPDFNVVVPNLMTLSGVKIIAANLLELYSFKQSVEKDFEEHKHVVVCVADALNPSNVDGVFLSIILTFHLRNFGLILK